MGLFEPEIVLHAIDHVRANDEGRFCWCVPKETIDQWRVTQRMWLEGYNTLDEFWTAHYGKHDPFVLGVKAIHYGVTIWECHNGVKRVPVYGRHRLHLGDTTRLQFFMCKGRWARDEGLPQNVEAWLATRP